MNTQAQATAETPIIDFAANAANRAPRRRSSKRPNHPDAYLIDHCIEYAMHISSGKIAYEVDPTDATFAWFRDDLAQGRATRALSAILEIEPVTVDGLRAKAALVKITLEDWDGNLDELRQRFLIS